jgi:hypothetical protein
MPIEEVSNLKIAKVTIRCRNNRFSEVFRAANSTGFLMGLFLGFDRREFIGDLSKKIRNVLAQPNSSWQAGI